ncbi:styrene monooxygenase/indole monooxygenase family protein [Marinitenerispora sediminis]|uniref:Oxygenase n=1 Tax=Marinitenerispora sediminis TaxID=1931232 RepID=A0A368T4N1_9ACTN|nr:styrene monooxygenase/indole monooxygenase family protein [Marinitenerispora sediminis]RCV50350.1 oxygenase [Marinitenerispora sediminis]RCV53627.1 oxygenase [Marinitenerispora sediminis]RCV57922.1 oxygenase [Marinitenerispora sediminis]
MRRILVVGAGQSGLYLAHGLLERGYDVTLLTGRTSTEVRHGKVAVSQLTFPSALAHERRLDLDFWRGQAPSLDRLTVDLGATVEERFSFGAAIQGGGVSMDRRVKMADWLEAFEDRGGKVTVHGVTVTDLDYLAGMYDLTVVATGHGELGQLFDIDPARTGGGRRRVAIDTFVFGAECPVDNTLACVFYGGLGSMYVVPSYTPYGPGHSLFMFGEPGGPLDLSGERLNPVQLHERVVGLYREHAPHLYEQVKDTELIDDKSAGIEHIEPYVRDPVGTLPSGRAVLGMADTVLSIDPVVLQGWNNSTVCAGMYLDRILAHGDAPFDAAFMRSTFDEYWEYGQQAILLGDLIGGVMEGESPPHVMELFKMLPENPALADGIVSALDDPRAFTQMMATPEQMEQTVAATQ